MHETDYRTIYKENFDHPKKQAVQYTGDENVTINKNKYQTQILLHDTPVAPDPDAIAPIDRIPVVGYQGYNPTFMNPLRKFKRVEELKKLYDSGWVPPVRENAVKDLADIDAPCVGYTGFLKGKKAENVHGQTFQKTALESIIRRKNEELK